MEQKRTVAIHQPNFLPWLGYFHKIAHVEIFVFLDDVEYTKNSFINRNKIKTPQGEHWLTIPVVYSGRSKQKISETRIFNPEKSIKKVLSTLEMNYKKAKYFQEYFPQLKSILMRDFESLAGLNIEINQWICEILDIKTEIQISSELNIRVDDATDRLIEICRHFNATSYLSGFGGSNYQEKEKFAVKKIDLITTGFEQMKYHQLWGDYIPNMSVIDALFNTGKELRNLVY